MNDLSGWMSQVQQWTESTHPEMAPQNRYLRDGVAWMHVGLSWLSFGVFGFAIIESIVFFQTEECALKGLYVSRLLTQILL